MDKPLPKELLGFLSFDIQCGSNKIPVEIHFNVFGELLNFSSPANLPDAAVILTYGNLKPRQQINKIELELKFLLLTLAKGPSLKNLKRLAVYRQKPYFIYLRNAFKRLRNLLTSEIKKKAPFYIKDEDVKEFYTQDKEATEQVVEIMHRFFFHSESVIISVGRLSKINNRIKELPMIFISNTGTIEEKVHLLKFIKEIDSPAAGDYMIDILNQFLEKESEFKKYVLQMFEGVKHPVLIPALKNIIESSLSISSRVLMRTAPSKTSLDIAEIAIKHLAAIKGMTVHDILVTYFEQVKELEYPGLIILAGKYGTIDIIPYLRSAPDRHIHFVRRALVLIDGRNSI